MRRFRFVPALGLVSACALALVLVLSGCDSRPQTGDLVEDVPGQEEGMQRSMEHMEALMKSGGMGKTGR